jgi:hypothetical protein
MKSGADLAICLFGIHLFDCWQVYSPLETSGLMNNHVFVPSKMLSKLSKIEKKL